MKTCAAIRTNKWGEEEQRLASALAPVFGGDLAVVFHDRPARVDPPLPVVDLNAEWLLRRGFALVPDWGWRCGDYFLYALREARPDYDHYWLIEPDVFFSSDCATFFKLLEAAQEDALGYRLGPFAEDIRFTRGLPGVAHHRAIFALTRFSGRALDRLATGRKALQQLPVSLRDYPNDEVFAFSTAVNDAGLVCGRLEDYAPEWFADSQFAPDPDLLFDVVSAAAPPRKIMHPVRGLEAFKRALGKRLSGNTGILGRMREAIDVLSEDDVEDIASIAADHIRSTIRQMQQQRMLRRRRQAGRS